MTPGSACDKNKLAMASLFIVVLMLFLCFVFAWFCTPPNAIDLENKFAGPSAAHWLGTDQLGRDIFSRTLYGGQISLLVGFVATAVALLIGITYGAVSGFAGGRTDAVMMRGVDTLFAIPFLVVVIVLREVISGWTNTGSDWLVETWNWNKEFTDRLANLIPLFIALGVFGWLTLGRIVRAQVMSIKEQEFVEAARSLGLSNRRILFRHIIPIPSAPPSSTPPSPSPASSSTRPPFPTSASASRRPTAHGASSSATAPTSWRPSPCSSSSPASSSPPPSLPSTSSATASATPSTSAPPKTKQASHTSLC